MTLFTTIHLNICIFIHAVCFFLSSPAPEESSPRVKPKFKQDTKLKDPNNNNKLSEPTPDKKRKFSRPKAKFPKSKDKVNVWTKQGKAGAKKENAFHAGWLCLFLLRCQQGTSMVQLARKRLGFPVVSIYNIVIVVLRAHFLRNFCRTFRWAIFVARKLHLQIAWVS